MNDGIESRIIHPNVIYTLSEACKRFQLSRYKLVPLLVSGELEGVKVGSQWRIPGSALLSFASCAKTLSDPVGS